MNAADKEQNKGFCRVCYYWQETEKPLFENRPILLLTLIIFYGISLTGSLAWGMPWWVLLPLGIFLSLATLPFLLLPLGTVTIIEKKEEKADFANKTHLEKLFIIADGKKTALKTAELPSQMRIYFWRRGTYPVLVLAKYQEEEEARIFSGELNFYEERTANLTIEVTQTKKGLMTR